MLALAVAAHRDNDMIYEPTDKRLYNTVGRRRGVNGTRPNVLGACGLVNLGNTCFLNTALQCLSHTPLFRAYLLSNRFLLDVNRQVRRAGARERLYVCVTYIAHRHTL